MSLKLYNTLTRKKSIFKPIINNQVGMYACGPTVYDYAHIGNMRTYVFEDILKRTLLYKGFKVKHVMNITDVGHLTGDDDSGIDKMLLAAEREKKTAWDIAKFYTNSFFRDTEILNIIKPDIVCNATDHIKEMIELIQKLEKKKFTYISGGNVYYDVNKFKNYGKLALLKKEALKPGARIDVDENKKNPRDFVLWFTKSKFENQEMQWDSPWGRGYPGWHIECSAMSMKYLGDHFDIHCGGIDHIPVHHTNEIAQSEGVTGKKWVNYWIHGEFILVEGKKMSKSLGNFLTLRDLLMKGYSGRQIRYLLLSTHYRQPLNFTFQGLDAAKSSLQRIDDFILNLKTYSDGKDTTKIKNLIKKTKLNFEKAMDDDLNISLALSHIFNLIKQSNISIAKKHLSRKTADELISLMHNFDKVLGILHEGEKIPKDIEDLVRKREHVRKIKDFLESDKIRGILKQKGYLVEDTPEGPKIKKL